MGGGGVWERAPARRESGSEAGNGRTRRALHRGTALNTPSDTWVFNTWFLGRPESLTLRVWAAPKTIPECEGLRPPPFGSAFGAAGASQTSQIGDFRQAQKPCIPNQSAGSLGLVGYGLVRRGPAEREGFTEISKVPCGSNVRNQNRPSPEAEIMASISNFRPPQCRGKCLDLI